MSAQGRILRSGFRPARGLAGCHRQTLYANLRPFPPRPRPLRERWELPDGDFFDLDWIGTGGKSWVLVLAGIAGGIGSPYALRLLRHFAAQGWRAALLNYRGLSGVPNRLASGYHAGFTQDLDLAVHALARRHGPGIVIGFSMGANVLLKWLGETGGAAPLRAAAAVSAPFLLAAAAARMHEGDARLYGRHLLACLKRYTRHKRAAVPTALPAISLRTLRTLPEFDGAVTAPLHGFRDAQDYYERASCGPWLRRIAVPTLIVNALDDPLIPPETLPSASELAPSVTLELCTRGGHVGFIGRGRGGLPDYWLGRRLSSFVSEVS